ncbi:S8 family serine peptidase [Marinobacter sp.]|uniref:S8 family serine peptidase n=1 Tax=Marinobacter sp. TaxID=50741 RepID=UPI0034A1C8AF
MQALKTGQGVGALLLLSVMVSGCGGSGSSEEQAVPDLAGVISLESRTRVDLDTADDFRLGVAGNNNSGSAAQILPNTAVVGGYLSAFSARYITGTADAFDYVEDRVDVYAATLSEGDRLNLQVFGAPQEFFPDGAQPPQRTLKVTDPDSGAVLAEQSGSSDFMPVSITLPEGFQEEAYLVEVSTSGGIPFRYVFTLAPEGALSVMNTGYTEPDFLLDEAIVSFRPTTMSAQDAGSVARSMSASHARKLGGNSWRVRRTVASPVTALSAQVSGQNRKETVEWIQQLRQRPDVAIADLNYLYSTQAIPAGDNPLYDRQWNYPLINLPLAWQVAPEGGDDVGIAVMDTGLFSNDPRSGGDWHPDLLGNVRLVPGQDMDYVSAGLDIDNEPGPDANPADPGDGQARSSNFHGTHVAGIAGAVDNDIGVIGVAPNSNILPVRVLGEGGVGNSADLIAAINWAATRPEIDVINLSLGGLGPSQSIQDAIDRAWDGGKGKLVVAAAGNQGTDEPTYPAAFTNVVGVGAVDGAGVRASYSNVGLSVNLVAPGGDASRDANQDGVADVIASTWGTDDGGAFIASYAGLQGTSMAAPHVSGVYALMKSAEPDMTPDKFYRLLADGELTQEPANRPEYGAGMIDALKAVNAALEGDFATVLAASPSALQFNGIVNSQVLELAKYPTDPGIEVNIQNVSSEVPWLTSDLTSGTLVLSDPVTVSVDPAGLDQSKSYSVELSIDYNSSDDPAVRTLSVPVTLQFGGARDDLNAGRHYVLLVSTDDNRDTVEQTVVEAADGQYRYAFDDVPPGEYFLVAGTDMDNNGLICENGEACAEYPVNGLPEKIVIGDEPLSGVTLNTSFRRPTIAAMGLPRYGFEGYRLKPDTTDNQQPERALETDR